LRSSEGYHSVNVRGVEPLKGKRDAGWTLLVLLRETVKERMIEPLAGWEFLADREEFPADPACQLSAPEWLR